ncbi:hypothetical protein JOB18_042859 [Solea senegalensis]|uniref:Uncharacterized protein n=1 Tax=Solea senegalensis TaxID=28829 RepID=A0AAV6QTK6_SOLSE|nr:hypothetical protein JOB18_042859 [Solea senegalensis]
MFPGDAPCDKSFLHRLWPGDASGHRPVHLRLSNGNTAFNNTEYFNSFEADEDEKHSARCVRDTLQGFEPKQSNHCTTESQPDKS